MEIPVKDCINCWNVVNMPYCDQPSAYGGSCSRLANHFSKFVQLWPLKNRNHSKILGFILILVKKILVAVLPILRMF